GGLRIDTPFARIRGAAQDGGIGILTLAALAFSTIREIQATSRSDAFLVDGTITYKDLAISTFAGRIAIDAGNIINANQANAGVGITGTTSGVEDGGVVTITIIDGSNQVVFITTTTVTNGTWLINLSSTDAKALADGSYTVTADVSNAAGNHALASQLITVDQDVNEHPSVLVNVGSTTPIGATGAGQVTFTISGLEPDDSGTLTFSDQAGHAVVVTIVNGQAVDTQSHPISTANLSSLSDGTIPPSLPPHHPPA